MRIEFHPEATDELEDSTQWYAQRSMKAAHGFVDAVEAAIDHIAGAPERFPKISRYCRALSLRRYPFQIIYRMDASRLQIVAVAHAKRRPGYWKRRL